MRLCPHASLVCKPASLWPPIARAQLKTNRAFCLSGPSVPGAGTKAENGLGARTNEPTPIPWLARIEHSGSPQTNGESFAAGLSRQLDAVIMLAGGQTPEGGLPPWVERRLDTAHGVLQRQPLSCPILCLGGGTPHKPPVLNRDGYVIHESTSCADYLMARGVPALRLLKEVSSYDTVGNAMFALTIHAIPAGWRNVAVVTSDFHMPRTRSLFEEIWARAAKDIFHEPDRYTLWFVSASDDGLFEPDVLQARKEKEAQALAAWRKTAEGLHSLKDVHAWFYATHQCYAVPRQHEFSRRTILDPRLLASY